MKTYLKNFLLVLTLITIQICNKDATAQVSAAPNINIITLEPGKSIEHEISASDIHHYQVMLVAGQFLRAVVDQRGIDVVVTVFDPNDRKLLEIDSPNGAMGPEILGFEADTT
ncbi:MAG: hypothetical protein E4H13_05180, partial [Calditrichales bacterium]